MGMENDAATLETVWQFLKLHVHSYMIQKFDFLCSRLRERTTDLSLLVLAVIFIIVHEKVDIVVTVSGPL